jgi:hypothetical protein
MYHQNQLLPAEERSSFFSTILRLMTIMRWRLCVTDNTAVILGAEVEVHEGP